RQWISSSASRPPLVSRLLLFLTQRFYDVEMLISWKSNFKRSLGLVWSCCDVWVSSDFRFVGQSDWFRANRRGKFSWDFLQFKNTPLEEVDMSHTLVNYTGLTNLATQKQLRTLRLRGCPEIDDWFLARLHIFQDSLEELDISECPRITTGGLVALRNLKGLKLLNVSSLPRVSSPGLVIILLEEMLPQCQITAEGYNHSLRGADEEDMESRKSLNV
uniref:Distal membrane-arm assembly complex protein 2 n=1 Tax=Oryzias melastigma TaxID=30732 RepID=A0A3B3CG28_ORYME